MRIECPNCAAAYDVPESMLSPGRQVRCARCGQGWAPVAAPPPEPAPRRSGTAPVQPVSALSVGLPPLRPEPLKRAGPEPRGGHGALWAWLLSLLVVAAVLAALWIWRDQVAAAWPPAARLFQAISG